MIKSKKGIETKFLIGVIVLIASFLVILGFYSIFFNDSSQIDKKSCHTGVIARATSSKISFVEPILPFPNCKTEKICITSNIFFNGDCEDELGKDYINLRISKNLEKQNDEIVKIFAEKNYECWNMMGEGKIKVFAGQTDLEGNSFINSCVICTRVAFDKTALEKGKLVKEVKGLYKYQLATKIPNSDLTFHQFLTNSYYVPSYGPDDESNDIFLTSQKAIVFFEVTGNEASKWLHMGAGCVSAVAAGAVVGSFVPVVGTFAGGATGFFVGCATGAYGGKWFDDFLKESVSSGQIVSGYKVVDYNRENIGNLGCSNFQEVP